MGAGGLSWKNEFTGVAAELAGAVEDMGQTGKSFRESWINRLTSADTVSETDILTLYANQNPAVAARAAQSYVRAREYGDNRLVLDHAMSDVAGNLIVAAREAVDSYGQLQSNTNHSNTALAQSQVAGAVTQGNLTAAIAQLLAFQAARQAAVDGTVKLAFVERAGTRDRDLSSSQAAIVTASEMRKERPRSSR